MQVPHLALLTPRGRYDLELFPKFMNLHGKSYNYKIRCVAVRVRWGGGGICVLWWLLW